MPLSQADIDAIVEGFTKSILRGNQFVNGPTGSAGSAGPIGSTRSVVPDGIKGEEGGMQLIDTRWRN